MRMNIHALKKRLDALEKINRDRNSEITSVTMNDGQTVKLYGAEAVGFVLEHEDSIISIDGNTTFADLARILAN